MATIPVATAMAYLAAGLSCLPATKSRKHPAIGSWKNWQTRLPTEVEVRAWFSNPHDAICVVSGAVSGNLECLDFDNGGELFGAWMEKIDTSLLAQLVIEQTPSGGYHVCYRCEDPVEGNLKIARGIRDGKQKTLIETRGDGGLFLCAPTEGYALQQGDFVNIPTISKDARDALLDAARSLDELPAASCPTATAGANVTQPGADFASAGKDAFDLAPGDDFNARGDIKPLLLSAGWQFCGVKSDGNEQWTRPGKDPRNGMSATYKDGSFYVFSSNAAPFEPNVKYSPFAVYATLHYNGDYTAAASALLAQGYGKAKSDLGVTINLNAGTQAQPEPDDKPLSAEELLDGYPTLRPVLIDGYLREGEIMNLIAAPKTGKSWFVLALALHIATGRVWLGHTCAPGKVLIIDNELHRETFAQRLALVMKAMEIPRSEIRGRLDIWSLRGKWKSVEEIGNRAEKFKAEGYKLIIVDAFYRALPRETDENDNGAIATVYNMMDVFAQRIGCAFILIHHTSKGNQSMKSITDVGSGAGSQSRAADTHMTLREHKDEGYLVLESVVRSFPKQEPIVLKKAFPLMVPDYEKNPEDLAGKAELGIKKDDPPPAEIAKRLVELVDAEHPQAKGVFIDTVRAAYGLMEKTAKLAVERAIADGVIVCGRVPNQPRGMQATKFIHLPEPEGEDDEDG